MFMPAMPLELFEFADVAVVEGTVRFFSALAQPASRIANATSAAARRAAVPNLWRPNIVAPP